MSSCLSVCIAVCLFVCLHSPRSSYIDPHPYTPVIYTYPYIHTCTVISCVYPSLCMYVHVVKCVCLLSKVLLSFSYEEVHPLTVADPGCSAALLYWQVLGEEQTMRALCVSSSTDVFSWSLPLSLKFVRHSFALPVSEHVGKTTPCLLTCHEQAGQ